MPLIGGEEPQRRCNRSGSMNRDWPPLLVAACGNTLAGDDAFGPLVAEQLRRMDLRGVEVVDLGMQPAGLVSRLEGRSALIVVDAAAPNADFLPGQLIDLDFFDPRRPSLLHDSRLSSHGLSIPHELELAGELGILPRRVRLIAAPAVATALGAPMSAQVKSLIHPAARRAGELARVWLPAFDKAT